MKARVYEYDQTAEKLTGYYVADWLGQTTTASWRPRSTTRSCSPDNPFGRLLWSSLLVLSNRQLLD